MAKPQKTAPNDNVGTPTSIILSVLSAIVIYSIEELKASVLLSDSFALRSVLLTAIGLGLALCFFWRRLPQNMFRMASSGIYLFGLWITLFFVTLAPILLQGEAAASRFILCQQFGLASMAASGLTLMLGFLGQQKPGPGVMASGMGTILLLGASVFGFMQPGGHAPGEEVLSAKATGHGPAAAHEGEGEEQELSAHAVAAGHEEHANQGEEEGDAHGHAAPAQHSEIKGHAGNAHGAAKHEANAKTKNKGKGMALAARSLHGDEEEGHQMVKESAKGHAALSSDDHEDAHENEHVTAPRRVNPEKEKAKAKAIRKMRAENDHDKEKPKAPEHAAAHWAYEGASGPRYWADLDDDNRLCKTGKEQSPIDIPASWPLMEDITLDYRLSSLSILDNGHTIQFSPGPGNSATIAGRRYQLMQFHIHAPSEHKIDGHEVPMEIHFVHKDAKGQLAVIGVLVEKGKDASRVFDEIWDFVPQSINNPTTPKDKTFNILALLPAKLKVYRYRGSLTTPPCSENVLWSVASEPLKFSEKQIKAFEGRYRNNARPVQKTELSAH